jgi:hypothetical protein
MAPVKGSCKKGVFGRCFGAVSTATFFSLETRRKKKDSMRQRTEKREKFSFFYKRVLCNWKVGGERGGLASLFFRSFRFLLKKRAAINLFKDASFFPSKIRFSLFF